MDVSPWHGAAPQCLGRVSQRRAAQRFSGGKAAPFHVCSGCLALIRSLECWVSESVWLVVVCCMVWKCGKHARVGPGRASAGGASPLRLQVQSLVRLVAWRCCCTWRCSCTAALGAATLGAEGCRLQVTRMCIPEGRQSPSRQSVGLGQARDWALAWRRIVTVSDTAPWPVAWSCSLSNYEAPESNPDV